MALSVLQLKKRYVCGSIAFIWIVVPTFEITLTVLTTDIVEGTCAYVAIHDNRAIAKTVGVIAYTLSYLLPLALMLFFYGRVVRALRSKVFVS